MFKVLLGLKYLHDKGIIHRVRSLYPLHEEYRRRERVCVFVPSQQYIRETFLQDSSVEEKTVCLTNQKPAKFQFLIQTLFQDMKAANILLTSDGEVKIGILYLVPSFVQFHISKQTNTHDTHVIPQLLHSHNTSHITHPSSHTCPLPVLYIIPSCAILYLPLTDPPPSW